MHQSHRSEMTCPAVKSFVKNIVEREKNTESLSFDILATNYYYTNAYEGGISER